jgi:hypothetical protein
VRLQGWERTRPPAQRHNPGTSVDGNYLCHHNKSVHSTRFNRPVFVTRHAAQRMAERQVDEPLLLRVIDEGSLRYSDAVRVWAWLDVPGRDDNLICAALVLDDAVVVKTVMHRWELMP